VGLAKMIHEAQNVGLIVGDHLIETGVANLQYANDIILPIQDNVEHVLISN
jgi:hypothetical protein